MTTTGAAVSPSTPGAAVPLRSRLAPLVFAATLFASAALLFAVQPMFTKMVLPRLGGSPSVWSVAIVSFQTFLFIGYVYAHVLARLLPPTRAAIVHLVFLALVATTLPLGIAEGFGAPPTTGVIIWLIGLFAASIGLPFVALSATAPLLQNWFAATGHVQARNPYVLYAASNLGSFCALIAYPFAVEPFLPLHAQRILWSIGFSALALLIAAAAFVGVRNDAVTSDRPVVASAPPTLAERLTWMVLAAIPSGLVIAVTSYITVDLAAAPFLWVVPLGLYLLTFVAVFRERPWIPQALVRRLVPYAVAPLAISVFGGDKVHWFAVILLNLTGFVLLALACHGEAYRRRPAADRLTEFYLWISFGGVLGGVFAGLVAPSLFNNIYEYPILIGAALLALSGGIAGGVPSFLKEALPGLVAALLVVVLRLRDVQIPFDGQIWFQALLVGIVAVMLLQAKRPARYFGLAVLAFVVTALYQPGGTVIDRARSFFGVHKVVEANDGKHRLLYHGTTIHGAERIGDDGSQRPEPLTYFYFGGPISDVVDAARRAQGHLDHVAVVGLGAGSLACHQRDGEHWTFYEIDPEVVRIARDERYFHYLSSCGPDDAIVLGDARLTLAASSQRYNLIILDAFSSDAIPAHLLTREAIAGYLARLAPPGVIAFHVSNRHVELASVVAAVGASEGLVAYYKEDDGANDFTKDYRANAQVVAMARTAADLGDLPSRPGWRRIESSVAAWTDDYSDVLRAILRKKLGR
jgi:hypothetical protein